jgi:hypothetical protein
MTTCVDGAIKGLGEKARPYCNCMLQKMESKYPNASRAGDITMSQTMDMAKDCLDRTPVPIQDSLPPSKDSQ